MANERTKAIEIVVLIALAIITQVIVGTLGQVTTVAGGALPVGAASMGSTNSVNAILITPTNTLTTAGLTLTMSGATGSISTAFPVYLTVTGNSINTFATNTVYATPGPQVSYTYLITNNTSPQTLSTNAVQFYNGITVSATGITAYQTPSITFAVVQTFNSVVHSSNPSSYISNTFTLTGVDTVTLSTANQNFNSAGTSVTTVLNFMSIIFLISAVVILLSLFGLDKIFNVGGGRE